MTPLIDVVFLLLIFFLVATKFEEQERSLKIATPQASEAQPLTAKSNQLFINISQKGEFNVGGQMLDARGLDAVLEQAKANTPQGRPVVLRADRRTTVQPLMTAMNLCNKHGFHDYVATAQDEEEQ